jgi:hypothetical protein
MLELALLASVPGDGRFEASDRDGATTVMGAPQPPQWGRLGLPIRNGRSGASNGDKQTFVIVDRDGG